MKSGFIPHEALSSALPGQISPHAPASSLETRVSFLENQINQLLNKINGFDDAQWRAEYKEVIRELAGGNKKPLADFMKKYGRIPRDE